MDLFLSFPVLFLVLPGGTPVVSSPGAAVVSPVATLNKENQNDHYSCLELCHDTFH